MKLAVLSDIHGNSWALQAVLEDAKGRAIDHYINLGDIFYGPLNPGETFNLLQPIHAITILGNQDRTLLEAGQDPNGPNSTLAYVLKELGKAALDWLASHPKTQTVADEVFACHGNPKNDMIYLLEDISRGYGMVKSDQAILEQLAGIALPVVLCGHSHLPRLVTLSNGQMALNPGSVGLPAYDDDLPNRHVMQTYSPLASYAILEKKAGAWTVELVKIPYNHLAAAQQAVRLGRQDWASWLASGRA